MPKFESTLHLSRCFVLIQLVLLSVNILITCYLPFSWIVKIITILCLSGSSSWSLYRHLEWQAIGHDDNGWYLQKMGEKYYIVPLGESMVTSFVSIIRFSLPDKRFKQSHVIFKDAMTKDQYREFIVRVRYFK